MSGKVRVGAANPQWRGVKDAVLRLARLGWRRKQIADHLQCSYRYTGRVLKAAGIELGRPQGADNHSWKGGRKVDLDGYVLLQTKPTRVSEHRKVAEQMLGRPLLPDEVVDHIDGITIHNDPSNLRVFASNGEHLAATISGKPPRWSTKGRQNIGTRTDQGLKIQPVDIYRQRKERGDVRLRAILRAALELGIEHPCLSGTRHWLTQNGIDPYSRPSLERAWDELERRYAADLVQ